MRTHWYKSPEPPQFGQNLTALCGEVIPHAQPVIALWNTNEEDCGLVKCRRCEEADRLSIHCYMAVIQSGEESVER